METYIVDATQVPWRDGETEGLRFRAQVLLDGAAGGPEALRFRFEPCPSVYAHMHLTSQFQVLLDGEMDMPRGRLCLHRHDVHYTDHNVPYGPFSVAGEHDMLVLHPQPGGLISMKETRARREIFLEGRLIVGIDADHAWRRVSDAAEVKTLIVPDIGPSVALVRAAPGRALEGGPAPFGRYEVVIAGSVAVDGATLDPPAIRFVRGANSPVPLVTGPAGATVMFLSFDQDALSGGLTGVGIAREAAEALAKAI